ncbi:MAG: adenylate/guanylate cyclase domain-containing protein [Alphaproteobacteria bacterium]
MSDAGPAILIVDDVDDNRYTLARRLKSDGYANIAAVESGAAALDKLTEGKFDLVLLDVMMPAMSGIEVLERIKSDPKLRHIPVIMISAADEMEKVVRCIQLGAEDYLAKPFNATLLKARVGAALEKKRLRDRDAEHRRDLEQERKRIETILGSVFPGQIASELKDTQTVAPRRHERVAVLFADVVGFTRFCDANPPELALGHLRELVAAFEEIAPRHGVDKIKTVGDSFMAAAGLLGAHSEPALAAVRCGLEMAKVAQTIEPRWSVRVGIHFGPVVAGVLGRRQYVYDIWGDTVNTAARIVGQAGPGSVVVSDALWMHVEDRCSGRFLGPIELKGKGKVELFECLEAT